MIKKLNGDACHDILSQNPERKLDFIENGNFADWKKEARAKFLELFKIDRIKRNACGLNVEVEETVECDTYRCIRFTFESEKGATVPCYLLLPHEKKEKYPVAITLQGHTPGFHNSIP
jgi:cephalosporin-C deacetylase-like acetyl esterase